MKRPIVLYAEPPRWTRAELVRKLGGRLRGRAREAFLIGSHAEGRATADSDVDLILVQDTALPWPERGRPFADLRRSFGAMDLIVYTPAEWQALSRAPTPFLRHARRHWVSLALGQSLRCVSRSPDRNKMPQRRFRRVSPPEPQPKTPPRIDR